MSKPATKIPPVPAPTREPMTYAEAYYFSVLQHWYRHRTYPPSIPELQPLTKPTMSMTAIRSALLSLESKGYVLRNDDGRFEVCK